MTGQGGFLNKRAAVFAANPTAVEWGLRNGCRAFTHNVNYAGREARPWDWAADRRESCAGTWRIIADIMFTRRA